MRKQFIISYGHYLPKAYFEFMMIKNHFQSTGTKQKMKKQWKQLVKLPTPKAKTNHKRSTLYGFTPSTIPIRLILGNIHQLVIGGR